jgi:hypothetical protein
VCLTCMRAFALIHRDQTKQAAELVSEARSEVYAHNLDHSILRNSCLHRNELFETFRTNYGVVEQEISDLWSQIIEEIHPFTVS